MNQWPDFFRLAKNLVAQKFEFGTTAREAVFPQEYRKGEVLADDVDLHDATLVTSRVQGSRKHKVVLDLDMDAALVPSTTPGHFHLYIDKEMDWYHYANLLRALAQVGIIERGFAEASISKGYSSVRPPWVKKPPPPSPVELARKYLHSAANYALSPADSGMIEAGLAYWLGLAMDALGITKSTIIELQQREESA